ncbi:CpsD/CapB family tyrosine-protein kinase [Paenibacillus chitinolyticus]|uniref:CpsD/CapB family tyrosine-protein kinase n=1 Tax=Paenibacillus chitinolyticus TaxID=79263 RepID=UPI0000E5F1BB|nr:CpsD/CapB family tyrosine-protein kinase [Paenibacillus chitinolyticus]MEC0247480.1 CpsD/CapB family tyrosine-protein kinase [Paenibacillus chitinolyticus]
MPALTNNRLITHANPKSNIAEAYRTLRTNIQFSSIDQEIQSVLVTSAQPEEGKSTTAANLAVAYAQENKKVLLIDADLRKPTLHKVFNVSNRSGLTHVLVNQDQFADALADTGIPNLTLLPSGPVPPNPAELLSSNRMVTLLEEVGAWYDMVIIDSPPLLAVTDSQILAAKADGVVLVLNHGKVKRDRAQKALSQLQYVKARVLGVVLNNKAYSKKESSYYYYYGEKA